MLKLKTRISQRGQIVIPKIVRENLGLTSNQTIIMELDDKVLKIMPADGESILESWKKIAEKEGTDVKKKMVYGDKLYEDVF